MLFFALVYVVEGLGQTGGLIAQPLNYFLKQVYGWTPVQVTASLTVLNLPWIIKPVYGIVSDFVPLFGYRRKAYLILANAVAVVGLFRGDPAYRAWPAAADAAVRPPMRWRFRAPCAARCWSRTASGCAAATPLSTSSGLWFNVAAVVSAFLGGELVARLSPGGALHARRGGHRGSPPSRRSSARCF